MKKYLCNRLFIIFAFIDVLTITLSGCSKTFLNDHRSISCNNWENINYKHFYPYDSNNAQTVDFTIKCPDGRIITTKELYGQWILIYFWSPRSCWSVEGLHKIEQAQEQFGDVMTTICLECYYIDQVSNNDICSEPSNLIMAKCNEKSSLYNFLNIRGFPTRVLVNPQGKIVEVIEGENHDGFPSEIKNYLKHLQVKIR